MSETWAWISGWGIQPERFKAAAERALPDATHQVFAPEPNAVDAALSSGASRIGGYSLGSLLLMNAVDRIGSACPATCLAPIPSFCKEAGLGGQTPRAILESLQAKLERNPQAALKLFYRLSGLNDEPSGTLPYSIESLQWSLEVLATQFAPQDAFARVHAIISDADRLIDSHTLRALFPQHRTVASGHDYNDLLPMVAVHK